jgi:hypothetical protein
MTRAKPETPEFVSGVVESVTATPKVARFEPAATELPAAASSGDPDVQHLLVVLDAYLTAGDDVSAETVRNRIREKGFSA